MIDTKTEESNAPPDLVEQIREAVRSELRAAHRREAAPAPLLTKTDVADVLNVSERTVDTLIASGELGSVKVRRTRRVPPEALESYVARLAREGAR